VRIVAIFVARDAGLDVTEADNVQLDPSCATSSIDWEQDRPCDQAADEAQGDRDLQVSKKEETIKRLVIEDIAIGYFVEGSNPVEHSTGQVGGSLPERH